MRFCAVLMSAGSSMHWFIIGVNEGLIVPGTMQHSWCNNFTRHLAEKLYRIVKTSHSDLSLGSEVVLYRIVKTSHSDFSLGSEAVLYRIVKTSHSDFSLGCRRSYQPASCLNSDLLRVFAWSKFSKRMFLSSLSSLQDKAWKETGPSSAQTRHCCVCTLAWVCQWITRTGLFVHISAQFLRNTHTHTHARTHAHYTENCRETLPEVSRSERSSCNSLKTKRKGNAGIQG